MLRSFAAMLLTATLAAAPAFAAEPFTAAQKSALSAEIKQFILDNPQVLISSVEAYYNKQNDTKKAQEGPLNQFPAGLLDYPGTPEAGPKDAKVTMVEFFDYNCGYCKQVATDVENLLKEDKNVRVVFKELPILSDTSEVAARYALAAHKQGKYMPYHMALLQHQGPISETFLLDTAKTLGLDADKLKKDANTQDVRDMLAKNVDLAKELGVRGTPFFIIGREKVPGAIGLSRMKEIIAKESGTAPAAAPSAAKAEDKTSASDTPSAAAVASAEEEDSSASGSTTTNRDPAVQAEIDKARSEARAMIDDLKKEAMKMQEEAIAAQKRAEAAAIKQDAEAKAAGAKK